MSLPFPFQVLADGMSGPNYHLPDGVKKSIIQVKKCMEQIMHDAVPGDSGNACLLSTGIAKTALEIIPAVFANRMFI